MGSTLSVLSDGMGNWSVQFRLTDTLGPHSLPLLGPPLLSNPSSDWSWGREGMWLSVPPPQLLPDRFFFVVFWRRSLLNSPSFRILSHFTPTVPTPLLPVLTSASVVACAGVRGWGAVFVCWSLPTAFGRHGRRQLASAATESAPNATLT